MYIKTLIYTTTKRVLCTKKTVTLERNALDLSNSAWRSLILASDWNIFFAKNEDCTFGAPFTSTGSTSGKDL